MSIEVVFDIPPDIQEGLQNKTLTRCGGVIRSLNGKIYAHLQEVDPTKLCFPSALTSFNLLTSGLQVATLIYMQKKFKEIQSTLVQHTRYLNILNEKVDFLIKMKFAELEHDTNTGFTYLKRAANNNSYIEKAHDHFIQGFGKLDTFFKKQTAKELLKNYDHTMSLLCCLAKNCVGEQICTSFKKESQSYAIEDHRNTYKHVVVKMQTIDPPLSSFPDQELISIGSYWKKTQKIKDDAYSSSDFLEKHSYFDKSLRESITINDFLETKMGSYLYLPCH